MASFFLENAMMRIVFVILLVFGLTTVMKHAVGSVMESARAHHEAIERVAF